MVQIKPIKRDKSIQSLSREHHHGLLLCWKLRQGMKKNIAPKRMKVYTDWFYNQYVLPHFKTEEQYLFPVLGADNELVKKAISQHRRLTRLFLDEKQIEKSLSFIEEELDAHIRFEERILFNEIQQTATRPQLRKIKVMHEEAPFIENNTDPFWL